METETCGDCKNQEARALIVNCVEEQIWRNVCWACEELDRDKKLLDGCEPCKEGARQKTLAITKDILETKALIDLRKKSKIKFRETQESKQNRLILVEEEIIIIHRRIRAETRELTKLYKESTTLMDKGPDDTFYEWHDNLHQRVDAEAKDEREYEEYLKTLCTEEEMIND